MIQIPVRDAQDDLANTDSDIRALTSIVDGLIIFTSVTGGENRKVFQADILKYETLLNHAYVLREKIASYIANTNSQ